MGGTLTMPNIAHLDFETASQCSLKDSGVWRYAEDPSTFIICMAWAIGDEEPQIWTPDMPFPAALISHVESGYPIYAYNASFEKAICKSVLSPTGMRGANWRCSQAVANYRALPGSLEGTADALDLDDQKDKAGHAILKKYFKAKSVDEIPSDDLATIHEYCKKDVVVERAIHRELGDLPKSELEVWQLSEKMNERGISVDIPLAKIVMNDVADAQKIAISELSGLTDGVVDKPTQGARIIKWLETKGVITKSVDVENVTRMLLETDDDLVTQVLKIRQRCAKSSTAKYKTMIASVCRDGKLRGNLRYHGASPGRWAGQGSQLHNFPKGSVEDTDRLVEYFKSFDLAGVSRLARNVFDGAVSCLRPTITASPGDKLVISDFAGIEARVLAWYAGEDGLVEQFREGVDIYCEFASNLFGRKITKVDTMERFIGKTAILGLGFQMGAPRFKSQVLKDCGLVISDSMAVRTVKTYREMYPEIPRLWKNLNEEAIEAIRGRGEEYWGPEHFSMGDNFLRYTLPSGREISYHNPTLCIGKYDNVAVKYQRPLGKKMIWVHTFGGKWTENIIQAIARDILAGAMVRADKAGINLLLTIHDEIIAEDAERDADSTLEKMEEIMVMGEDWCPGLPLSVEGFTSFRFRKG